MEFLFSTVSEFTSTHQNEKEWSEGRIAFKGHLLCCIYHNTTVVYVGFQGFENKLHTFLEKCCITLTTSCDVATLNASDVCFLVVASPFALSIYKALIKEKRQISYKDLGRKAGHSNKARAVGNALNSNPIAAFIPCHLVAAKNGIGGYAFGIENKKSLL